MAFFVDHFQLNYSQLVCKQFVYDYRITESCCKNTKDCFSLLVEFEIQWSGLNYVNQEKYYKVLKKILIHTVYTGYN